MVNTDTVENVPQSWADLWKPEYAGKMIFLDDSRAVIGITLLTLGYDVNTTDPAQLEEANGYKAQVIAQAKGEASRFTQVLAEYEKAPKVMRDRLYIEAMESVMSKSSKVMVDVKGGNNMLYLPLDRMTQRQATSGNPAAGAIQQDQMLDKPATLPQTDSRGRDSARAREQR